MTCFIFLVFCSILLLLKREIILGKMIELSYNKVF